MRPIKEQKNAPITSSRSRLVVSHCLQHEAPTEENEDEWWRGADKQAGCHRTGLIASQRRRRRPSCWVRSREARTERKADCNHSKVGCKNALNFWKEKNQPRIVKMGGAIYTPDLRLMIPEIPLLTHKIRTIFCAYGHFKWLDCIN